MLNRFLKKLRWFLFGPSKYSAKKKKKPSLSRVYPLRVPLGPDEAHGWKRYPLFNRKLKEKYTLSCHASVLMPGHCPHPPHSHDDEEILIMLAGQADLLLPEDSTAGMDRKRRVKAGDFVYYPAYFPHSLEAVGSVPASYLMFKWSGRHISRMDSVGFKFYSGLAGAYNGLSGEKFSFVRLFEGQTVTLPKLQCHLSQLPPAAGYPAHSDPYDVAIIVLEGEVETLNTRAKPNDVIFYAAGEPHGMNNPGADTARYLVFEFHHAVKKNYSRPLKVGIEASTMCQLRCRTCPTARGIIGKHLGNVFLSPEKFEQFIRQHPWITEVELSNWGEVFLNPQISDILKIAFDHRVTLTIENGTNLNKVSDTVLEDLVRYRVRNITCSIDGASHETYSVYRVNGNFDKIIGHIKKINIYKDKYQSQYPNLYWQFVAFGHNEHEISQAREMAKELRMKFRLKLSWEDMYFENFSPVNDKAKLRSLLKENAADRNEYREKTGKDYVDDCCLQLWKGPRINADGRLVGCCINYWDDYGNAFEEGLEACLNSDKMQAARKLLMGGPADRKDIPCLKCQVYWNRVKYKSFVKL